MPNFWVFFSLLLLLRILHWVLLLSVCWYRYNTYSKSETSLVTLHVLCAIFFRSVLRPVLFPFHGHEYQKKIIIETKSLDSKLLNYYGTKAYGTTIIYANYAGARFVTASHTCFCSLNRSFACLLARSVVCSFLSFLSIRIWFLFLCSLNILFHSFVSAFSCGSLFLEW